MARAEHPIRPLIAVAATLLLVLAIVLCPQVSGVYAANVFGALRAPGDPAFIAGHRGDRSSAPENTIVSLQAALDSTLEFAETDVQLTADGVPVLMHDATVDRTTNGTGLVGDFTLEQLRTLDAGSWYSTEFSEVRVPTLEEFLDIFAESNKKVLLELKGFWSRAEVEIATDLVYSAGVQDRVTFSTKNFTTLRNIEAVAPGFPRAIIMRLLPADPVRLAQFYGAIAILTSPESLEENPRAVDLMHAAGLGILLYTLNSEKRWSAALALGVDGIVTDKPSSLDRWLAETAPET
jgi:glycerophosphoryl diester phosphodiesterase